MGEELLCMPGVSSGFVMVPHCMKVTFGLPCFKHIKGMCSTLGWGLEEKRGKVPAVTSALLKQLSSPATWAGI